jgi:hypothetical protein
MNWIKEECIRYTVRDGQEWCIKFVRLRAGTFLFVELVKRNPDSGKEVVKDLAHLPPETYFVSEPYFGEFFAAFNNDKLITTAWSWDGLLRALRARGFYVSRSPYLSVAKTLISRIEKTVSAGLSEDGEVVDPLGALDKTDHGVEPLKAAYKWVMSAYVGRNAEYAWYNVVVAITHIVTSPLRTPRYLRNRFLDYVVYNVLPYGYGTVMYVLERLLWGGFVYDNVIYGEPLSVHLVGSKRLVAALLDLNRLPLVLMGQTKKTLKTYRYVLETAGGEFLMLNRRGERRIPNLRGLIIFADDLYDIPVQRRLVLRWDLSQIHEPQSTLPPVEPIYGFAARLWRKYRSYFTADTLPRLVTSVARAIAEEIRDEAEEVATFTEHTVAKLTDAFFR